jgi:hypothetical protein
MDDIWITGHRDNEQLPEALCTALALFHGHAVMVADRAFDAC